MSETVIEVKNAAVDFTKWVGAFFDESKPQSFSRGITLLIVAFVLGWDTCWVHYNHGQLVAAATLLGQMGAASTFYIVRRAAGAYCDTHGADDKAPQQPNA